ncbi:hypothetical protein I4U23_012167 [Adineta vaga]|nr:hypothetical protein I4U23_012167 [Adineta vaga]
MKTNMDYCLKEKMGFLRSAKNWGLKIWLVISLLMGISTLVIGSHGVSKINADRNTKMLDRSKYFATFIYEILTACLKIIDPLIELVGSTYLYTIRLNFEQLTNTRYEACYYKVGNDTECTEAWHSLQNTYEDCLKATTNTRLVSASRQSYLLQKQQEQQIRLWQLIESIPTFVSDTDRIIDNTTINGTSTNVLDWWIPVANTTQEIYDKYLQNISLVTSLLLRKSIDLIPEKLQDIWSAINSTTTTTNGDNPLTTITPIVTNTEPWTNYHTYFTTQEHIKLTSQTDLITSRINSIPIDLDSSQSTTQISTLSSADNSNTSHVVNSATKMTETSLSPQELYSTDHTAAFPRMLPEVVRQQSSTQYTTNVLQWWNPFKQFLFGIETEYQQMRAPTSLPPQPPPECKRDIYHMRYIATDLTVLSSIHGGRISHSPALVVYVEDTGNIQTVVRCANKLNYIVNALGGGHSYEAYGLPRRGPIYYRTYEKGNYTINAGSCGWVGLSGIALGGVYGYLVRLHGLLADNILEMKVVNAQGELLTINETHEPELFWTLRGAGGGLFVIVTEFKFCLIKSPLLVKSYSFTWHANVTKLIFWQMGVNPSHILISITHFGMESDEFNRTISLLLQTLPTPNKTLARERDWLTFIYESSDVGQLNGDHRQLLLENLSYPTYYFKAKHLFYNQPISDHSLDKFIDRLASGSGQLVLGFSPWNGYMNTIPVDRTAFPHRNYKFGIQFMVYWHDQEEEKQQMNWLDDVYVTLYTDSTKHSYINYIDRNVPNWMDVYYNIHQKRLINIQHIASLSSSVGITNSGSALSVAARSSQYIEIPTPTLSLVNRVLLLKHGSILVLIILSYGKPMNTWTHVAFVHDTDKQEQLIYINGILSGFSTNSGSYVGSSTASLVIGGSPKLNTYFNGLIDELSLVTRVKDPVEILEDATLVFHYTFDSDKFLYDSGPNQINCTAINVNISNDGQFNESISSNTNLSLTELGTFILRHRTSSESTYIDINFEYSISTRTWSYVAFTYSPTSGLRSYEYGVQMKETCPCN